MTFAEWLRDHRKKAGLTQEQLAPKLGVTRNTIQNWENDRYRPRGRKLDQTLEYFGVPALPWSGDKRVYLDGISAAFAA